MAASRFWTFGVISLSALLVTVGRASGGERVAAGRSALQQEGEARAENDEVQEVRRRLKVMRTAVEILVDAGKRDAAHAVELAMHARELALERRDDPEARKIREAAPDRAALAELLGLASRLQALAGDEVEAETLADLAQLYREQARRREAAARRGPAEREQDPEARALRDRLLNTRYLIDAFRKAGDAQALESAKRMMMVVQFEWELMEARGRAPGPEEQRELIGRAVALYRESGNEERARALGALARTVRPVRSSDALDLERLEHRIEVLGMARAAYSITERADGIEYLGRFLEVAKMQLAGVDGEKLAEAAEGLRIGTAIELLQGASRICRERQMVSQARACNALAEFYARRERERGGAQTDEPRRLDLAQLGDRVQIWRLARAAFDESGWETSAAICVRMIHVGELLLEEAGPEQLQEAAEGMPDLPDRVALLKKAAELASKLGRPGHARACAALAGYYAEKQ